MPPGTTLPNPCYIHRLMIWDDGAPPYPPDLNGNLAVSVDPNREYLKASGFPEQQLGLTQTLKTLGALLVGPGRGQMSDTVHNPPIAYRHGDAIITAPNLPAPTGGGSRGFNVFLSFNYSAEADIVPRQTVGLVFDQRLNAVVSSVGNISIRNIIPPLPFAGTQVRARVATLGVTTIGAAASIGIRSGATSSTTTTPVPLKFNGGQAGFVLNANETLWSDWVNLTTQAGQSLMATVDLLNGNNNAYSYKKQSFAGNYSSASASAGSATMSAPTFQMERTHIIDAVEIH